VPKGTAGYHVGVLERAGLVRVVATRRVRAMTEKYYGRVARLFVLKTADSDEADLRGGALTAMMLRHAADEAIASGADAKGEAGVRRVRLTEKDALRFRRRLLRLYADYEASADRAGELYVLATAFFRSTTALPPSERDA
jgi:hypothetical protein